MAITNGYCTADEMKVRLGLATSDARDDAAIELAVESASRAIDLVCERRFYADGAATARTYMVPHCGLLIGEALDVDDMNVSVTAPIVKVDRGDDGTYETTLTAGTDYQLEPLNSSNIEAGPKNVVRLLQSTVSALSSGRAPVQVTAKWGWPAVPVAVKQACMIVALDLFKSKDAPFGVAGSSDFGTLRIRSDIAAHAAMLIARYRRYVHGIA